MIAALFREIRIFLLQLLQSTPGLTETGDRLVADWVLFAILLAFCITLWLVSRAVLRNVVLRLVRQSATKWDDHLVYEGVFDRLAHLLPAIILSRYVPVVFEKYTLWVPFLEKVLALYVIYMLIRLLSGVMNATQKSLADVPAYRDKPLASYSQLAKIIIWLVGLLIGASVVLGKNPIYMFTALGAASAVLLLIFKDTLLGFIGSIQLSMNDMLRVGDWVSVPKYGADGNVTEINLTTVKVRNFDLTITTVPTYSFIADSFKNWRGMEEGQGRRIKRSIFIKQDSIRFVDDELLERLQRIKYLEPFLKQRLAEIAEHNERLQIDTSVLLNGRRMTNIGVFRRYLLAYLENNPNINHNMTYMVRQLDPQPQGVPMEIYCFSKEKAWVGYEAIQSDLFDHIFAAVSFFDLEVHESPTGADIRRALQANRTQFDRQTT